MTMLPFKIALIILFASTLYSSKLNVPRVLLPVFDHFTVNFNIEVTDDGCYKWSLFRGDNIIKLTPLDLNPSLGCSGKASVSSLSNDKVRKIAIVFAEDISSGETVRCDVIVDTISSLQIVTKTRELFVGDAPELFEVSAFDDQGNRFTTLDGVEFQWSIKVLKDPTNTVLKFISFKDSPYSTPSDLYELDERNKQGHMVLVEGVKTGSAIVTVKLASDENPKAQVELSVIANLRLDPAHVNVLLGDLLQVDIYQIQNEKLVKINLPSNQYSIEADTSTEIEVLSAKNNAGLFKALKTGQIRLNLKDHHVATKNDTIPKSISSFVNVCKVEYLSIVIKPNKCNLMIIDNIYELEVHLYNSKNQSIQIGPNVIVSIALPDDYFEVINTVQNGSYVVVRPIKLGIPIIEASITEPYNVLESNTKVPVPIYSRIKIKPKEVIFPWHLNLNSGLQYVLEATGGDKRYSWSTNDALVCTVTSLGVVTPQGLGETYITATMTKDTLNRDNTRIYVVIPDVLKIIAQPVEQEAGKPIVLYVQLFAKKPGVDEETSINVCNHNQFKVEVEDFQFTFKPYNSAPLINNSCAAFYINSDVVSSTRVTVSFETDITILKASVIVSTFKKLVPLRPESKRTVLAPGCSTTLIFYGGPQPWLGHSIEYKTEFEIDSNLIEYSELPVNRDIDGHKTYAFFITCNSLGSTRANLTVKSISDFSKSSITEIVSKTSVEVICASPKFVKVLIADAEDSCPLTKFANKIVALNFEKLYLHVNIIDENGNIFDNATMVNTSWTITDNDLVKVISSLELNEIEEYGFSFPNYHYTVIEPLNKVGSTEAVIQITGYKKPFIIPNDSHFSSFLASNTKLLEINPPIKYSMTILLVNNVIVNPEKVLVIYHPKITSKLFIDQGSGYFNVHMNTQDIAKISHSGRQIDITPLAPGNLQLNVIDLCLKSKSAEVMFEVRSIYRIELLTNAFVEIGESIKALIKVYDSDDNPLAFQSDVLNIQPVIESNILSLTKIKEDKQQKDFNNEIIFNVKGLELGETNLYFIADTYLSKQIRTQTTSIRVYSPLQITPKNLTIAVGSSYQLVMHGGPQLECVFEYSSENDKIVKVINGGLVKGQNIGTAMVTGMAVGVDVITGKKVVYSKDVITIRVIKLTNIKIEVPLFKIKSGEIMPAWVRGMPDALSPIIIGTIKPSFKYHWSTSSAGIIQISDVLENTGILVREDDRLSVRIRAIRAGNTRISVTVTDPSTKVIFTNFIDITVYDDLRLISHVLPINSLIVTPNTEFMLMTNKYKVAKQSFWVSGTSKFEKNNLIEQDKTYNTPLITVDENTGLVKTYSTLGRSSIFISTTEDFNIVQSLDIPIEVKRVNYIMLNIEATIHSKEPSQISMVPSGMNMKLVVTYHDDRGIQFKAMNSDIKYLTNHFNQISMTPGDQKNEMEISLFESGEVILKIWDNGAQHFKEDYIKFNVEHLIYPNQATVTVGDVICFLMPVKFNEDEMGKWQSDNIKSLEIDNLSGISVALAPSDVFVTYSNNKFTTSTGITILPIKDIIILPFDKNVLSNSGQIDIPLVLINELETPSSIKSKKGNKWEWRDDDCSRRINILKRYPYICNVRFEPISSSQAEILPINRIYDVKPNFNLKTGYYSCSLTSLPIIDPEMSLIKAKIVIQVSSGQINTEFKEIKFLPSVFINKKELFFGQFSGNDKLTLIGLPQVLSQIKVLSSNESLVHPVLYSESENEKIFTFEVHNYFWNGTFPELHILISSPLTNQQSKIPVVTSRSLFEYDFSRQSSSKHYANNQVYQSTMFHFLPGNFSSSIFFNPYIISLAIVIITSCFIYCYGLPSGGRCITFVKSPPTPPSPPVGFYNRSYSSDHSNRSSSLNLNRSFTRRQ